MCFCLERLPYLNYYAPESAGREASFRIHYWGGMKAHYDHPLHRHSYFEVCCVTEGEGVYEDSGKEYALAENTLFLSRPGAWHKISSQRGIGLVWVAFELQSDKSSEAAQRMVQRLTNCERICLPNAGENPSVTFWKSLLLQADPAKSCLHEQLPSMAHSLLIAFIQEFADDGVKTAAGDLPVPVIERINSQLLYRIRTFIRDNLSQTIRLKDLASYSNISKGI